MVDMERFLSSSGNFVSLDLNTSWAAKSWDPAYVNRHERARFQQKQLQEKEEKLLKLYEEQRERALQRVGGQSQTKSTARPPPVVGAGKVRSMLQSRRDHGHDKSYPLDPLPTKPTRKETQRHTRTVSLDPSRHPPPRQSVLYFGGSHQDLRFSEELDFGQSFQVIDDHLVGNNHGPDSDSTEEDYFVKSFKNKRQFYENHFAGVSEESLSDSYDPKLYKKLPNVGGLSMSQKMEAPAKYKTFVSGRASKIVPPKSGLLSKQPLTSPPVRKTPDAVPPTRPRLGLESPPDQISNGSATPPVKSPPPRTTRVASPQTNGSSPKPLNGSVTRKVVSPPQRVAKPEEPPKPPVPASRNIHRAPSAGSRASVKSAGDVAGCRICGRNFAPDRLATHESICQKTATKKRKVFDPVKHRVKGTEAEKYVLGSKKATIHKSEQKPAAAAKPNWRRKHEEFINSIRAAKEVQTHLKKGGKLSDLPPPPPSDYSDYVQCPHCERKFNEAAASRHIPKCATMLHNKPKKAPPVKASSTFRKK